MSKTLLVAAGAIVLFYLAYRSGLLGNVLPGGGTAGGLGGRGPQGRPNPNYNYGGAYAYGGGYG